VLVWQLSLGSLGNYSGDCVLRWLPDGVPDTQGLRWDDASSRRHDVEKRDWLAGCPGMLPG